MHRRCHSAKSQQEGCLALNGAFLAFVQLRVIANLDLLPIYTSSLRQQPSSSLNLPA
jgi:hypothetical protein